MTNLSWRPARRASRPGLSFGAHTLPGGDGVLDRELKVVILRGLGETIYLGATVHKVAHAGEQGSDRELVVGQPGRGKLVHVGPLVAQSEPAQKLPLVVAGAAGGYPGEPSMQRRIALIQRAHVFAAFVAQFAAFAANQHAVGANLRPILVGAEVVAPQTVAEIEPRARVGLGQQVFSLRVARPRGAGHERGNALLRRDSGVLEADSEHPSQHAHAVIVMTHRNGCLPYGSQDSRPGDRDLAAQHRLQVILLGHLDEGSHAPKWFVRSENFGLLNPAPFFSEEYDIATGRDCRLPCRCDRRRPGRRRPRHRAGALRLPSLVSRGSWLCALGAGLSGSPRRGSGRGAHELLHLGERRRPVAR